MTSSDPDRWQVRDANEADRALLVEFNRQMALETESLVLDPVRLAAGVAAALADPSRGRYLVGERAGRPAACLMLTTEWSDWRNGWYWWIQSVFVEPSQRRAGAFRALYGAVLERVRQSEAVQGVRLYVDADNHAAQAVYGSLGLSPSHYRMFEWEPNRGTGPLG